MRYYIYKMIHLPTGRVYIGQRKLPRNRTPETDCYYGSGRVWKKIYNKHPEECVKVIIDQADTKEAIDELEIKYISHYKSVYGRFCVNIAEGGYGSRGFRHTEERKAKLREFMSGPNNPMRGKKPSELTRKRMSEARKRWRYSDEAKARMSEARKGKKRRKETCERMSLAKKGHEVSQQTRDKIRQSLKGNIPWNKGKKMSDEQRKKLSDAHKGKPNPTKGAKRSEETKQKLRDAWVRRKARISEAARPEQRPM